MNVEIEASMHPGSCRGRHVPRHASPAAAASPYGHFGSPNARRDVPPATPGYGWPGSRGSSWKTHHAGHCHSSGYGRDQARAKESKRPEEQIPTPEPTVTANAESATLNRGTISPEGITVEQAPVDQSEEKRTPVVSAAIEIPQPIEQDLESPQTAGEMQPSATPAEAVAASVETLHTQVATPVFDARFVNDVSIPDETPLPPAAEFTKVWKLENTGNVVIPSGTSVIFVGGERFSHKEGGARVEEDVAVGATFLVSLAGLRAPKVPGEKYTGFWRLSDVNGQLFGDKLWTE